MNVPDIIIPRLGIKIQTTSAVSVLNSLLKAGIRINHLCGGKAACGTCLYTVLSGMKNISPLLEAEKSRLVAEKAKPGQRLACQSWVSGNIEIDIPYLR